MISTKELGQVIGLGLNVLTHEAKALLRLHYKNADGDQIEAWWDYCDFDKVDPL